MKKVKWLMKKYRILNSKMKIKKIIRIKGLIIKIKVILQMMIINRKLRANKKDKKMNF